MARPIFRPRAGSKVSQGDYESAKEVEYDFYDLWGESIFEYV